MRSKIVAEDLAHIVEDFDLPWSKLEGKTILVTGANGMLPAYMVETLLYLNEKDDRTKTKVIGLARNKERALARFAHYKNRDDLELLIQDVCDIVSIETKIDYIIHAASQASPKYYGNDPVGTLSPNVLGTYNLLSLARHKRTRGFLFFSSGAVYGQVRPKTLIKEDAYDFISQLISCLDKQPVTAQNSWLEQCKTWQEKYPSPDPAYNQSEPGIINSYNFTTSLSRHLASDAIIATDAGTAFTCTHQGLELRSTQRFIASRGLGEMGFGLPAAIGASFANDKKSVVLITGDGSIMLNLQELQTVATHKLPLKVFLYVNNGYLAIRATQRNLFDEQYPATGKETGVVCPDMQKLFEVFGFKTFKMTHPGSMNTMIKQVLATNGPVMCEVMMKPDQPLGPRLASHLQPDGSIVSPPLEDLYPFLPREQLAQEMLIGLHPRSAEIKP